jgi:hypothetical protein
MVYSPDKSQRELMREMRVILNTFQTLEMSTADAGAAGN